MVSQLSTSECVAQPARVTFFGIAFGPAQRVFMATLLLLWPILVQAQGSSVEVSVEPLTAIDQQFMEDQRARVEQLANRIGRGLTGNTDRDLGTLQRILDERMVPPTDTLTLQAMGAVFGDLLGDQLDMSWVVYRDGKRRSRALRSSSTKLPARRRSARSCRRRPRRRATRATPLA